MVELAILTVGITLILFSLRLYEYFDRVVENAYRNRATIKGWMKKVSEDQYLKRALRAQEHVIRFNGGRWRLLWIWFPSLSLLVLFVLVSLFPSVAELYVVSDIELWKLVYFITIFTIAVGVAVGMLRRPEEKFELCRRKFEQ